MTRSGRRPKSPAFQWYAPDALTDGEFAEMTFEERGVFITLLSYSWINVGIPSDPERVRRLLRADNASFARFWPKVSACFSGGVVEGRIFNSRQEREREYQDQSRDRWKARGEAAAAVRWGNKHASSMLQASQNDAQALLGDGSRIPYPVSIQTPPTPSPGEQPPETKRRRKARDNGPMPEWPPAFQVPEFQEAWADWLKARSEKGRGGYAPTGLRTLIRQTEALGLPVSEIAARLRRSTAEGWAGPHLDVPINRSQSANGSRPTLTTTKPAYTPF